MLLRSRRICHSPASMSWCWSSARWRAAGESFAAAARLRWRMRLPRLGMALRAVLADVFDQHAEAVVFDYVGVVGAVVVLDALAPRVVFDIAPAAAALPVQGQGCRGGDERRAGGAGGRRGGRVAAAAARRPGDGRGRR